MAKQRPLNFKNLDAGADSQLSGYLYHLLPSRKLLWLFYISCFIF